MLTSKKTGIYKVTSPSGKIYIGQSVNIQRRFNSYRAAQCKYQRALYNSLLKYGSRNHTYEILELLHNDISKPHLDDIEIAYISFYKNAGYKLLNLTNGGVGCFGLSYTKKSSIKLSKAKKGEKRSNKTRFNMSIYHQNRPLEHSENNRKARFKPILQYDLNGVFIKEWESLISATSNNHGDIRSCAKGRQYTAGGYIWKYKLKISA